MSKEKDIQVKLGSVIAQRAKAKYKSNVEFANVCDVAESTIRRILQGEQNISIQLLQRICEALKVKMSDLLREAEN